MSIDRPRAGVTARARHEPAHSQGGRKPRSYLNDVRRFAMLERDQEYHLARRWREHGDRDAANQIVTSHLRLAVKIARSYRGYGLPASEVIAEGNVGLMKALNRYEPETGFRFATYAAWWIRASINDYILHSWSLVKIGTTANQKKLFFRLRSAKSKIAALESGDLHPDQVALIANDLDVPSRDVVDMNRRIGRDKSINAPARSDGENGEWQDQLVDDSPSPETLVVEQDEKQHQLEALAQAIGGLDDRERRIFEARRLTDEPRTFDALAADFNVSPERVRQIDAHAFDKVRKAAKNFASRSPMAALPVSGAYAEFRSRPSRVIASRTPRVDSVARRGAA
ncbi:RNA polymerase sigma factor RpoH [Bradyrhizobium tropiciagri]|nr:RNA polymerase sigma factor RpoH [Bradyrhizobium tropiciagri]MBR0870216.1 RNA polymerase sigma factor RpoH [Bradyrhizobium tropiciagri]